MQRELRLGDILDDYCPRERRITNHAVVAMVGSDVKQTRCTTCEAEHEYKHARIPRQRRKSGTPAALYSQVLEDRPKRVTHDPISEPKGALSGSDANGPDSHGSDANRSDAIGSDLNGSDLIGSDSSNGSAVQAADSKLADSDPAESDDGALDREPDLEEGPVHRPLIRATLPRPEGQPPPTRPAPDFTIRQPGGRPNRFRHRHGRGGQQFQHNRSNGNMGGVPRQGGGRPPVMSRLAKRQGHGRKRSK